MPPTIIHDDGIVVAGPPDQLGAIVNTPTDMYVLNQNTVGPDFDYQQLRIGQKVRIYFDTSVDPKKILRVGTLS